MRIKVNPKTGVLYMPKDLLDDGFKGKMDAFYTPITFTIVHPQARLEQVKESIENTIRVLNLREGINITIAAKNPSTVAEAVRQIMSEHKGEPLKVSQVFDLVEKQYTGLRGRVRTDSIYGAVAYALHRGVEKGLWIHTRTRYRR